MPTISGTAQLGETLTAETSSIGDADGLDNATFTYQWLADGADIDGATGSSYTLTTGEQGKTIKVRVSFTDDAGHKESLTSEATAEVEAALTAELRNLPESGHNGEDAFTFRILFSEDVTVGYQALKEDSFEISDGTITRARRVNGRNDLPPVHRGAIVKSGRSDGPPIGSSLRGRWGNLHEQQQASLKSPGTDGFRSGTGQRAGYRVADHQRHSPGG